MKSLHQCMGIRSRGGSWPRLAALALCWLITGRGVGGEESVGAPDERAASLARLKRAASEYAIVMGTGEASELQLIESPVLRFSDPVSSVSDGALFLWTRGGRPEAAAAFWSNTAGRAWIEFQSLSLGPLSATRLGRSEWRPAKPGVEFKPVPGAPLPDATPAQRLMQMRSLLRSFAGSISDAKEGRQELRALPSPVFRYAQPAQGVIDGGLFVFARSTNPELFVLIEAQNVQSERRWMYSPARMTGRDCELRYLEERVWTQPTVGRERDLERTYLQLNTQLPER